MDSADREGLGLSVLVYLGAVFGALALLAVPVYYAARGDVRENPRLAQSDPLLNRPIIGDGVTRVPLARLQPQNLADAETVKLLTVKTRKAEPVARPAQRVTKRITGTPVAELQTERTRPAMFPFSLF
jgi:hypothetical protein